MNVRSGRGAFQGEQLVVLSSAFTLAVVGILLIYSAATASHFATKESAP